MAETVFNCVLGLLMAGYLFMALGLPASDNPGDVLGAGGFPVIIAAIGLATLAFATVAHLRRKGGEKVHIPMFDLRSPDGRTIILSILLLAAYILLMDVLGFILATLLYLPAATLAIGYRKWGKMAFFTLALTVVIVAAFGKLFFVPLPRGVGLLRELSFLVY